MSHVTCRMSPVTNATAAEPHPANSLIIYSRLIHGRLFQKPENPQKFQNPKTIAIKENNLIVLWQSWHAHTSNQPFNQKSSGHLEVGFQLWHRQTDTQQTDIATLRQNRPKGWLL